jgi:hypothetical protein
MKMVKKQRHEFAWLALLAGNILDDTTCKVHIYVESVKEMDQLDSLLKLLARENKQGLYFDEEDIIAAQAGSKEWINGKGDNKNGSKSENKNRLEKVLLHASDLHTSWSQAVKKTTKFNINMQNKKNKKVKGEICVSSISGGDVQDEDNLLILYKPDNINSIDRSDLFLEHVEALCFNAALRQIPVVLINPNLIATAWSAYGPQRPFLVSDFAQIYFVCDDYFRLTDRGQWCGLVQRAATGLDLFLLNGLTAGESVPCSYQRIDSWDQDIPNDVYMRSALTGALKRDKNFVASMRKVVTTGVNTLQGDVGSTGAEGIHITS